MIQQALDIEQAQDRVQRRGYTVDVQELYGASRKQQTSLILCQMRALDLLIHISQNGLESIKA